MTAQEWIRRYRLLFALPRAEGWWTEEAVALRRNMTEKAWERLGAAGQAETMRVANELYQNRINHKG